MLLWCIIIHAVTTKYNPQNNFLLQCLMKQLHARKSRKYYSEICFSLAKIIMKYNREYVGIIPSRQSLHTYTCLLNLRWSIVRRVLKLRQDGVPPVTVLIWWNSADLTTTKMYIENCKSNRVVGAREQARHDNAYLSTHTAKLTAVNVCTRHGHVAQRKFLTR